MSEPKMDAVDYEVLAVCEQVEEGCAEALLEGIAQETWEACGKVVLGEALALRERYAAWLYGKEWDGLLLTCQSPMDIVHLTGLLGATRARLDFGIGELETIPALLGHDHAGNVLVLMDGGVEAVWKAAEGCRELERLCATGHVEGGFVN